jgi:predicted component of type VI protein secretion system
MKLSLVVLTEGKSIGKSIPITLSQFVIGRDPQCQLRPASAVISKRHCALLVRDGKVFLRDFDSTNGTFVNDQPIKGEVELHHEDRLKVGPLVFAVKIETSPPVNKPTPAPPTKQPAPTSTEGANDDEIAAMLLEIKDEGGSPSGLGSEVPEGSTVMDLMAPSGEPQPEEVGDKQVTKDKPSTNKPNTGNTSSAAKALLEKYMRRPRS